MTRPSTRLLALARLLENAARIEDDVNGCIHDHLNDVDGYSGGSDAPKVSHTSDLTPTEAAAEGRLYWSRVLTDRQSMVHLLTVTTHNLINEGYEILRGAQPASSKPRCNGSVDATCRNIPIEDGGLCLECLGNGGCPECRSRPIDTDHTRQVEGQKVCEACYRRRRKWSKVAS